MRGRDSRKHGAAGQRQRSPHNRPGGKRTIDQEVGAAPDPPHRESEAETTAQGMDPIRTAELLQMLEGTSLQSLGERAFSPWHRRRRALAGATMNR